jgi:hypothetical protein
MMPQTNKNEPINFFRPRFRFGLAAMLTLMLVTTIAASGGSYLWSAAQGKRIGLMVFFPFVLIVPFALMIALSWISRIVKNDRQNEDDHTHFLG